MQYLLFVLPYAVDAQCTDENRPQILDAYPNILSPFVSPNYPDEYDNNTDCHWLITANLSQTVSKQQDVKRFFGWKKCDESVVYEWQDAIYSRSLNCFLKFLRFTLMNFFTNLMTREQAHVPHMSLTCYSEHP